MWRGRMAKERERRTLRDLARGGAGLNESER